MIQGAQNWTYQGLFILGGVPFFQPHACLRAINSIADSSVGVLPLACSKDAEWAAEFCNLSQILFTSNL